MSAKGRLGRDFARTLIQLELTEALELDVSVVSLLVLDRGTRLRVKAERGEEMNSRLPAHANAR